MTVSRHFFVVSFHRPFFIGFHYIRYALYRLSSHLTLASSPYLSQALISFWFQTMRLSGLCCWWFNVVDFMVTGAFDFYQVLVVYVVGFMGDWCFGFY